MIKRGGWGRGGDYAKDNVFFFLTRMLVCDIEVLCVKGVFWENWKLKIEIFKFSPMTSFSFLFWLELTCNHHLLLSLITTILFNRKMKKNESERRSFPIKFSFSLTNIFKYWSSGVLVRIFRIFPPNFFLYNDCARDHFPMSIKPWKVEKRFWVLPKSFRAFPVAFHFQVIEFEKQRNVTSEKSSNDRDKAAIARSANVLRVHIYLRVIILTLIFVIILCCFMLWQNNNYFL